MWGATALILYGSEMVSDVAEHSSLQHVLNNGLNHVVEVFNHREWIIESYFQSLFQVQDCWTMIFDIDFLTSVE